jgi:hypothetical protein
VSVLLRQPHGFEGFTHLDEIAALRAVVNDEVAALEEESRIERRVAVGRSRVAGLPAVLTAAGLTAVADKRLAEGASGELYKVRSLNHPTDARQVTDGVDADDAPSGFGPRRSPSPDVPTRVGRIASRIDVEHKPQLLAGAVDLVLLRPLTGAVRCGRHAGPAERENPEDRESNESLQHPDTPW